MCVFWAQFPAVSGKSYESYVHGLTKWLEYPEPREISQGKMGVVFVVWPDLSPVVFKRLGTSQLFCSVYQLRHSITIHYWLYPMLTIFLECKKA